VQGVLLAASIAVVAHVAVRFLPFVSDVVVALALGILAGTLGASEWAQAGANLVVRYGLRLAIIALGAGLNLTVVAGRGWLTLLVIVILVAVAMTLGLLMGRAARLQRTISVLLGVGTAICGASAILAVTPLIRAREKETAYAITTIFAFNIVALVCLPFIGHEIGISQLRFGTWVGTAVNDTSIVVATGYVYGPAAGGVATLVKLTRTILLVPLCVIVGLAFGDPDAKGSILSRARQTIPWFVLGFFALAAVNSAQIAPAEWTRSVAQAGSLLLVGVLAAVGLGVDLDGIRRMGVKPLAIGFALAGTMALISLGLISALRIG
jgi:uncharacterized integral membrane protein (TIGR00698 family)